MDPQTPPGTPGASQTNSGQPLAGSPATSVLRAVLLALVWLWVSGVLLVAGFSAYQASAREADSIQPLRWPGSAFRVVEGTGGLRGSGMQIRSLAGSGRAAAMVAKLRIDADSFQLMEYRIEGLDPKMVAGFIWVTREHPRSLRTVRLNPDASGFGTLNLEQLPDWDGQVARAGFLFEGSLGSPLVIRQMSLRPFSLASQLGLVWREWTAFEGWTGHSINFIIGGPKHVMIQPVAAAAAWVGLALVLYWVWVKVRRRPPDRLVGISILLLCWLALDARWLLDLGRQNLQTEQQFEGKTGAEKRLADKDGSLFKFVLEIRNALPAAPQRVFLVTREPFNRSAYARLRASYHLLPHNVYSHLAVPPDSNQVQVDDYVLLLGRVAEGIHYDQQSRLLEWAGGGHLATVPELVSRSGALYRVIKADGVDDAGRG